MRKHLAAIALTLVFLAAYIGLAVTYGATNTGAHGTPPAANSTDSAADSISVVFVPSKIDPSAATVTGLLYVTASEHLAPSGVLSSNLNVVAGPTIGAGSATFEKGQKPGVFEVTFQTDGAAKNYPFDSFTAQLVVGATVKDASGKWGAVPTTVHTQGELTGWTVNQAGADTVDNYGVEDLYLTRTPVIIGFALLMLALMVVLGVLAVLAARAITLRRRKIEIALASWMAALLFALIPIRNFLPGAPPLGSWIDILVFFWVELVLVGAMAFHIRAWLKYGPKPDA